MWHLTACKISVSLSFFTWIKNEMIFYHISELMLATLIQKYDKKNHLIFDPVWLARQPSQIVLPPFIWKRAFSKRKELAPKGSQFFPFGVDLFSEQTWSVGKTKVNIIKVASL